MRFRTTLILAIILGIVSAFYYLYEYKGAPKREKARAEKDRIFSFSDKDFEELTIKKKDEMIHLKRDGDGWGIIKPLTEKGDKEAIDSLVNSLTTAKKEREIDANPQKLSDYGLEKPSLEVEIKKKGDSTLKVLQLGDKNPTETFMYAKIKESPAVFLISRSVGMDVDKKLFELRDKTVISYEIKDIKTVDLKVKGKDFTLKKISEDIWNISKPVEAKADRAKLQNILEKFKGAKIKEFIEEKPRELIKYGLNPPESRLTLWIDKDKDKSSKTLYIGKLDISKKGYYARREGKENVFLLDEEILKEFPSRLNDLRDMTIISFDRDKAQRIEFEVAGSKGLLVKNQENKWEVQEPFKAKADQVNVSDYMLKINDTRGNDIFGDNVRDMRVFRLDKPDIKIRIWEKDVKDPKTLLMARLQSKKEEFAAVNEGSKVVYKIDSKAFKDLSKSPSDFQDKSMLTFDSDDIKKLQIKNAGKTFVFEKKGEEWRMLEPKKGNTKPGKLTMLLWDLKSMKFKEIVSEKSDDLLKYGIDNPESEIQLIKKDDKELETLQFGKRDKEKVFVKKKSSPVIFTVESRIPEAFPRDTTEILK